MAWSLGGILAGALTGAGKGMVEVAKLNAETEAAAKNFDRRKELVGLEADAAFDRAKRLEEFKTTQGETARSKEGAAYAKVQEGLTARGIDINTPAGMIAASNELAGAGYRDASEKMLGAAIRAKEIAATRESNAETRRIQIDDIRQRREATTAAKEVELSGKAAALFDKRLNEIGTLHTQVPGESGVKPDTRGLQLIGNMSDELQARGHSPGDVLKRAREVQAYAQELLDSGQSKSALEATRTSILKFTGDKKTPPAVTTDAAPVKPSATDIKEPAPETPQERRGIVGSSLYPNRGREKSAGEAFGELLPDMSALTGGNNPVTYRDISQPRR